MRTTMTELWVWILGNSWKAAVLVGVVLILRALAGRRLAPAWRHALWWVVVLRLIMPPISTSPWSLFGGFDRGWRWGEPASSELHSSRHSAGRAEELTQVADAPLTTAEEPMAVPRQHRGTAETVARNTEGMAAEARRAVMDPQDSAAIPSATDAVRGRAGERWGRVAQWMEYAGLVWALGVLGFAIRLGMQHVRFTSRLAREAVPGSMKARQLLERCRSRMGVRQPVRLAVCSWVETPAVYGWRKPVLLLPEGWESAFTDAELTHIFLHELAHVRRGDLGTNALAVWVGLLHWFNPVVQYALRWMRFDRELAADALVLEVEGEAQSRAYGQTIVRVVERWVKPSIPLASVGILEHPAEIVARVRAIVAFRRRGRATRWAGVLLAGVAWIAWTDPASEARTPDRSEVLWKSRFLGLRALAQRADAPEMRAILTAPETARLKAMLIERVTRQSGARLGELIPLGEGWKWVIEGLVEGESMVEVRSIERGRADWAMALRNEASLSAAMRETLTRLSAEAKAGGKGLAFQERAGWLILGSGGSAMDSMVRQASEVGTGALLDGALVGEGQGDLGRGIPFWDPTWKPAVPKGEWPVASWKLEIQKGRLRSQATLRYAGPLGLELPEWKVPTQLIREPLIYFSAQRGTDPWQDRLGADAPSGREGRPNQAVEWALAGPPWQQYVAVPVAEPRRWLDPWAAAGPGVLFPEAGIASAKLDLRRATGGGRLDWAGLPYFQPFVAETTVTGVPMVVGGLFPSQSTGDPIPEALVAQWRGRPDIVRYEWETTGSMVPVGERAKSAGSTASEVGGQVAATGRLRQLKELEQFRRLLNPGGGGKPVLGRQGVVQVPGSEWIDAMAPRLGDTVTEVHRAGPSELQWIRRSQLGLNAREWMALWKWISGESGLDGGKTSHGSAGGKTSP